MSEAKEKVTVNNDLKEITNEKGLVYKPAEDKLVVVGTLTQFRYSTRKFDKDKEYYQVSVKTDSLTPEVVAMIKARYLADTKEKYYPSFVKAFDKGEKGPVFVNLKSLYEIGTFVEGEGNKRYSYDDVVEMGEGLAPLGSEVKLSIRLKSEGFYPLALMIVELNKQDASDFFE